MAPIETVAAGEARGLPRLGAAAQQEGRPVVSGIAQIVTKMAHAGLPDRVFAVTG